MSFSFPSLREIGNEAWNDLVFGSPDGWAFSLAEWQAIVTSVSEWAFVERGFGVAEGKRLLAVVPFHLRPEHSVAASSGWGGSGPVICASIVNEARARVLVAAIGHMEMIAKAENASVIELSCSPVTASSLATKWGVNPFELQGWADKSRLSQVIDLSAPADDLWKELASGARQAIRKAERAGLRVERVDWAANLDTYYAYHSETYERTGVQPHPRAYFAGMARHTAPMGVSVLYAALTQDGEPVAFHNDACFGAGATYHTGCSRSEFRKDGVDYLLMWHAICEAQRAGITWYDCGWIFPGSTDEKQKGLTFFKTRFGGVPHRAFAASKALERTQVNGTPEPQTPDMEIPELGLLTRLRQRILRGLT